jgi:PAS domain S-box-containing protein
MKRVDGAPRLILAIFLVVVCAAGAWPRSPESDEITAASLVNFTVQDGLVDNEVKAIFQDREGYLWIGTKGGLSRYDGTSFVTYTMADGLVHNEIKAINQDRAGHLWIATQGGLNRYDGETFITFTSKDGLEGNAVHALYQDREGYLWVGTDSGGLSCYNGVSFVDYTAVSGLAHNEVEVIAQDRAGHLWIGSEGGLSRYDGVSFVTYTTTDGLVHNKVKALLHDQAGHLWIGSEGGLSRYDGVSFVTYTVEDGLASNQVWSLLQDRAGHLWIGSDRGVSLYDGKTFVKQEGLAGRSVRAIVQDREGYCWFGTEAGMSRYYPSPSSPPLVSIDAVVADQRYEQISELTVASGSGIITVEFSASSPSTHPDLMLFRYRLIGYENTWQTTPDRRVEYVDLPRGDYVFEVEAIDHNLVYSEQPARVAVRVHLPYGWVGLWTLLGLAVALAVVQTVRVIRRDRRLHADLRLSHDELEKRVEERTAELSRANDLFKEQFAERRQAVEALQESEKRFRILVEQAVDAFFVVQPDGRFVDVNQQACTGLGYTRKELLNLKVTDIQMQMTPGGIAEIIKKLDSGRPLEINGIHRRKDGTTFPVEVRIGLVELGGRQLLLALVRDISERKQMEEARRKAEQELEEQRALSMRSDRLRSLGEMAAGIAHELNQPLVGVRGLAEHILIGLERGWELGEEKMRDRISRIVEQADRMVHIIEHVRLFAREAGKPEPSLLQVNEVVQSSLDMLQEQFRSHGLELECELAEGLPLVMANPFSLEEVLLNLLNNARDALEEKPQTATEFESRRIQVRTDRVEGTEPRVRIEIVDSGAGIPAEILEKVFDPFFTTKGPDKGTGLGLAISRTIVESFGGLLEIHSAAGKGTTATILLPTEEAVFSEASNGAS